MLLVWVATQPDLRVRLGDGYRDPRVFGPPGSRKGYGSSRSLHNERLAIDLILDKRVNGRWVYQRSTAAYRPLGELWMSLGGEWGGEGTRYDGNHFSLSPDGRRW